MALKKFNKRHSSSKSSKKFASAKQLRHSKHMASKTRKSIEERNLVARSAETGRFLAKEGFKDLSDIVRYAIEKTAPKPR